MNRTSTRGDEHRSLTRRVVAGAGVLAVSLAGLVSAPATHAAVPTAPAEVGVTGDVVSSPDGGVSIGIDVDADGQLVYSVAHDGVQLIASSALGLHLDGGRELGAQVTVTDDGSVSEHDSTWETYVGTDKEVRDHYDERTVTLQEDDGTVFSVVARAYDDGVAFRYHVPDQSGLTELDILDEATEFQVTGNPTAYWIPQDFDTDEETYQKTTYAAMGSANTPVTLQWDDTSYMSIHEADLDDYAAMTLKKRQDGALQVELVPSMMRAAAVVTNTGRSTPWRALTITNTAGELIESHLLENLNPPPDASVYGDPDTSWVQGSTFMGVWWAMIKGQLSWNENDANHGATTARVEQYIDYAAAHGIHALLAEGWNKGWEGSWGDQDFFTPTDDLDLPAVLEHAQEKGVKFIGHNETGANPWNYENQINQGLFQQYEDWGIHYIKTGYVGDIPSKAAANAPGFDAANVTQEHHHYDQTMVNHYRFVWQQAAEHHINVDCHECIHATGEIRTFPNAIAREAMRGQEYDGFDVAGNSPQHTLILPFTRMLAGPMDYTPGIMNVLWDPTNRGTRVHATAGKELAEAVNYFSGVTMAADTPENYAKTNDGINFYRGFPSDWDETKVLSADIGDHLITARRNGDEWWIGAMNADTPETLTYPLDFLGSGTWVAEIYTDDAGTDYTLDPSEMSTVTVKVTSADSLVAALGVSGGQAVHLRPATAADDAVPTYQAPAAEVTSITAPSTAEFGDLVTVKAVVKNTGSLPTTVTAPVTVSGRSLAPVSVKADGGGTATATFDMRALGTDPLQITVGDKTATIRLTGDVAVPTGLAVTGSTSSSVSLSWDAVPGASYEVYRRSSSGRYGAKPLGTVPVGTTSFVDTSAGAGTFDYVVRAVADGKRSAASDEVSSLGVLVGTLTDPVGDDHGPGSYTYPTAGVYTPGVFDVTGVQVYDAGDTYRFVTSIAGDASNNPWADPDDPNSVISLQHLEIYVSNGDSVASVPARIGTNMDVDGSWNRAVVIDGRFHASGVYDSSPTDPADSSSWDDARVADVHMQVDAAAHEIIGSVAKSALPGFSPATSRLGVAMFANSAVDEGIDYIRPFYDVTLQCNLDLGYVTEWRGGGGLGCLDGSLPSKDSDTTDANAYDIVVPEGQSQADVMDWNVHSPVVLPTQSLTPAPAVQAEALVPFGSARSVTVGQSIDTRTGAYVAADADAPVAGQDVTFTVSGPASFVGGGQTATVTSGARGKAALPPLTAGSTPGTVTVTASSGALTAQLPVITVKAVPVTSVSLSRPMFSAAKQVSHATKKRRATVTTTVSGASSGTVVFREGAVAVGKSSVKAGKAMLRLPKGLSVGKHRITAFIAATATTTAATSPTSEAFRVVKAKVKKLKVKAAKKKVRRKGFRAHHKLKLKVKVSKKLTNGRKAKGKVKVKVGKKTVKKISVKKLRKHHGKVKIKKRFVHGKKLKVKAVFKPKHKSYVKKAKAKVTLKRKH